MLACLKREIARLSRWLNEKNGGEPGKTLCWQWATDRHPYCLPCIVVGLLALNLKHCFDEINGDPKD